MLKRAPGNIALASWHIQDNDGKADYVSIIIACQGQGKTSQAPSRLSLFATAAPARTSSRRILTKTGPKGGHILIKFLGSFFLVIEAVGEALRGMRHD